MASLNANQNMASCWPDSALAPDIKCVRARNISNRSLVTRRRIGVLAGPTGITPVTRTIISDYDRGNLGCARRHNSNFALISTAGSSLLSEGKDEPKARLTNDCRANPEVTRASTPAFLSR